MVKGFRKFLLLALLLQARFRADALSRHVQARGGTEDFRAVPVTERRPEHLDGNRNYFEVVRSEAGMTQWPQADTLSVQVVPGRYG